MINIIDNKDCCGCFACVSKCPNRCIELKADDEGFWYPQISKQDCTDCGLCEQVCPIFKKSESDTSPMAFAAYSNDPEVRMSSSSGGIFTVVAGHVLDKGGVVFGAEWDDDYNVIHGYAQNKNELARFRGSKYVQSKIGDCYKHAERFLKQGRDVLFSGTPCQIAGLKSYLQKEYENLCCVDIICHGVPSPKAWLKYLAYREKLAKAPITSVNFRSKQKGWRNFSLSILFDDTMVYNKNLHKDIYLRSFLHNISLRPSCYACRFKGLSRASDLTLADFWGVESVLPHMSDDRGTSLVLVHSDKGKVLFDAAKNDIVFCKTELKEAIALNSAAVKSANKNPFRNLFFRDLNTIPFDILVKKYCRVKLKDRIRRKVGSVKRALRKRIKKGRI